MGIWLWIRKVWEEFWELSFEKKIEFALSLSIVFFAWVQWRTTVNNNESSSQQNERLIEASKYSAYAADRSAQAASAFAQSAQGINHGVQDAVGRLQAQAQGTKAVAEASTAQANASRAIADQASAQASAAGQLAQTAHQQLLASERPWMKVNVRLLAFQEHQTGVWVDEFQTVHVSYEVVAQNTGSYPATKVQQESSVVFTVAQTAAGKAQDKYCEAPTKPFDILWVGEGNTAFPGEPDVHSVSIASGPF